MLFMPSDAGRALRALGFAAPLAHLAALPHGRRPHSPYAELIR